MNDKPICEVDEGERSKPTPDQQCLLARYKENADQARHYDSMRERSTAMVAQTTGLLLGLLGFQQNNFATSPVVAPMAAFVILLGLWGIFSSLMFERRARRNRKIRDQLILGEERDPRGKSMIWVWVLFHTGIVLLGVTVILIRYPTLLRG